MSEKPTPEEQLVALTETVEELQGRLQEREAELSILRDSESSYRAVIDNQMDLICRYELEHYTITFANVAFCRFFDRSHEETIGACLLEIVPSHERAEWEAQAAASTSRQHVTTYEQRTQNALGEIFWLQWREIPLLDLRGESTRRIIQASATDITRQKMNENALRRSAVLFQSLIELATTADHGLQAKFDHILKICCDYLHMDIGIVSHIEDTRYTILYARSPENALEPGTVFSLPNTYCEKTFAANSPVGFHYAAREPDWQNHPAYLTFKLESYLGSSIYIDGKPFGTLNFSSAEPRSTPFTQTERTLINLAAQWIGFELGREHAQQALMIKSEELELSNHELERFAYVVSHDLQEPLRTVRSFTEMIAQLHTEQLDEESLKMMGFILEATERMQRMLSDLLSYSRVTSTELERKHTALDPLLDEVLLSLNRAMQETEAVIERTPLPALPIHPTLISQLLQNLTGNALKFRGEQPPVIKICAEPQPDGAAWTFTISDNGIGIAGHHLERIFDVFQRLHNREEYEGNGIGLAICKRIVEKHGGQIFVASEPGAGTTFKFTISSDA